MLEYALVVQRVLDPLEVGEGIDRHAAHMVVLHQSGAVVILKVDGRGNAYRAASLAVAGIESIHLEVPPSENVIVAAVPSPTATYPQRREQVDFRVSPTVEQ